MIYVTGDCHGDFKKIEKFCRENKTTREDILIVLGDAGINFYNDIRDFFKLQYLSSLPVTLFCIHGNHERRPTKMNDIDPFTFVSSNKPMYRLKPWLGGKVYRNSFFPNVLFARDGDVYDFDGVKVLVCGGAYSPDKPYRLKNNLPWFADEQPSTRTKHKVERVIQSLGNSVDIMLTHTIPYKYLNELHLSPIEGIDNSTEKWLDGIENNLNYKAWYAGHFHMNRSIGKLHILMEDIVPLRTYL